MAGRREGGARECVRGAYPGRSTGVRGPSCAVKGQWTMAHPQGRADPCTRRRSHGGAHAASERTAASPRATALRARGGGRRPGALLRPGVDRRPPGAAGPGHGADPRVPRGHRPGRRVPGDGRRTARRSPSVRPAHPRGDRRTGRVDRGLREEDGRVRPGAAARGRRRGVRRPGLCARGRGPAGHGHIATIPRARDTRPGCFSAPAVAQGHAKTSLAYARRARYSTPSRPVRLFGNPGERLAHAR